MSARLPIVHEERREPDIVVLRGATWADFERLLAVRGECGAPRFHYLAGSVEIMSPSRHHEGIKSAIGCLVQAWCLERGVDLWTVGSWTLKDKALEAGAEPDECYVFGPEEPTEGGRPDLAIEVQWSRRGLNKLEIYRRLGVREVWIWDREVLTPYELVGDDDQAREQSTVLPDLDLGHLAGFIGIGPTSRAIREYRAALATHG